LKVIKNGTPTDRIRLGASSIVLYTVDVTSLIESHGMSPRLPKTLALVEYSAVASPAQQPLPCMVHAHHGSLSLSASTFTTATWTKSNWLQLNPDKTEVLWFATSRLTA